MTAGANAGVEVDWSALTKAVRQLEDGVDAGTTKAARTQAAQTAATVRNAVPVRTGALRATVDAVDVDGGAGVTYGGGLRYAWPVEAKSHALRAGTEGAGETFSSAMQSMVETEVRRL